MRLLSDRPSTMSYRRLSLVVVALSLMVGAACGSDAATETPTSIPPTPLPTATPPVFPVAVVDGNGEEVVFQEPPQRIVALDSAVVEFLFAMGAGNLIAGMHDFVSYPPEAEGIPRVGSPFNISAEKILVVEPDLVSAFFAGSIPQLKELGVKVLYIETPENLDGILEQIHLWGRVTDNDGAAGLVAADFESRLQEVEDGLASLEQGPRVFHDDSLLYTRGPDTLLGQVYALLKAENIAHDLSGYGQLSPEVIVERDPEVIITTSPERPQEFIDDPAFQGVSAIRNGRVYLIEPQGLVSVASTRFVEGIELLARLIHPDLFE